MIKKRFLDIQNVFPILFFFSLIFGLVSGLEGNTEQNNQLKDEEIIQLIVGEAKKIPTNIPSRITVVNPDIADVTEVTSKEITVVAKLAGFTTLTYVDSFGERAVKIRVFPEDIQELKRRVDNLLASLNLPDVYTQGFSEEGKIALLGKVNSTEEKDKITTALAQLSDKIVDLVSVKEEETVIEIDVQLLEIDKGYSQALGFTWPSGVAITEVGSPGIATKGAVSVTTGTTPGTTYTETTGGTSWGKLFRVLNVSREAFSLTIDALVSEGKARVLSRPRLACQSGKDAELFVGGEKPIMTTAVAATTGATATSVEYKEYGIKLKIRPTISEESRIKLSLNMEVSEVESAAETLGTTTSITAKAFPLIKRSANTELFLNDGQTLAIGGLVKQKTEEDRQTVPGLGNIPIIGALFRSMSKKIGGGASTKGNTELFITLTPHIVATKERGTKEFSAEGLSQEITEQAVTATAAEPLRGRMMNVVEYTNAIQKRILEVLHYPDSAKESGFQGTVKLRLHISYVGELMDVAVKESSGYKILDESALRAAKEVGFYPPFPSSIQAKDIWIDVPIVYQAR